MKFEDLEMLNCKNNSSESYFSKINNSKMFKWKEAKYIPLKQI